MCQQIIIDKVKFFKEIEWNIENSYDYIQIFTNESNFHIK